MKTTVLELFGTACLAAFAAFVWLPGPLLVLGIASLAAAWSLSRPAEPEE